MMKDFLKHIADASPGFRCYDVNDPQQSPTLDVKVTHTLGPPAGSKELNKISKTIGDGATQIVEFYEKHNGVQLYCQGSVPALEFFPVGQWRLKQNDMEQMLFEPELAFEFQKKGTVFGEVSGSGNHLVLYQGRIYYSNYDGGDDTPIAGSFFDLLTRICNNPAQLLADLGGHTRYQDGKTDAQCIPKEYVPEMP
jgi:hypothetical protein